MVRPTMNYNIEEQSIQFFCEKPCKKGTIMGYHADYLALPLSKSRTKIPIGVCLNDVVNIDATRYHLNFHSSEVMAGGKIRIMTKGEMAYKLAKRPKIPIGQPIYVNVRTNKLDWRYSPYCVGYLISTVDRDGFARVKLDFNRK